MQVVFLRSGAKICLQDVAWARVPRAGEHPVAVPPVIIK
jgi:hypothetical protein